MNYLRIQLPWVELSKPIPAQIVYRVHPHDKAHAENYRVRISNQGGWGMWQESPLPSDQADCLDFTRNMLD